MSEASIEGAILTVNAGSSSVKLSLFDPAATEALVAAGLDGEEARAILRGSVGALGDLLDQAGIDPGRVGRSGIGSSTAERGTSARSASTSRSSGTSPSWRPWRRTTTRWRWR